MIYHQNYESKKVAEYYEVIKNDTNKIYEFLSHLSELRGDDLSKKITGICNDFANNDNENFMQFNNPYYAEKDQEYAKEFKLAEEFCQQLYI